MLSSNPTTHDILYAQLFSEPLVPILGEPSEVENAALSKALLTYSKRTSSGDFSGLKNFIDANPKSSWRASLLTNLGSEYFNTGHYSKALKAWEEAWELSKTAKD